jgi:hypothetical protein
MKVRNPTNHAHQRREQYTRMPSPCPQPGSARRSTPETAGRAGFLPSPLHVSASDVRRLPAVALSRASNVADVACVPGGWDG